MDLFNNIVFLIGSIMTVLCILCAIVLVIVCKGKDENGNRIEIDNKSTENSWSMGTWIAGVFVAGMGVALMYATGDLVGYVQGGLNPTESVAMVSLLNGIPVWALYSIMGIWYMKHMDSLIGKYAAMLSTVLGMSISLWTGMNTVVRFIGISFPGLKFLLAAITVAVAMFSAKKNLLKKMSQLAFIVFVFAMLAVISTPFDEFAFAPISGGITVNFWKEYFMGPTAASWIFWFLSWTPTVARWLAHISKGRTMREYIIGSIVAPSLLTFVWMTVSWMYQDVIVNFNLVDNTVSLIPCVIFIISGILLMTGTLDSDCRVFTEDLESVTKGKLPRESTIVYYGLFVLAVFCLFISGIIKEPFAFNEYSSLLFVPLVILSVRECVIIIKKNK